MTDVELRDGPDPARPSPLPALPLQYWFAAALAVGSVAIFLGERLAAANALVTIGVPIAVMAAYIAIGRGYLEAGISRTQYADSIYYLGFLFTLVSITAAITEVGPGADVSHVVNRFGVKLITTLVGLGTRVYLVNFKASAEDVAENVEETLQRSAERMRERLDRVTLDLDALASALALTLTTANDRTSTELSRSLTQASAQLTEALGQVQSQTGAALAEISEASVRGVGEAASGLTAGLRDFGARVDEAAQRIASGSEALVARMESMRLPGEAFAAQLAPAVEAVGRALREPAHELGRLRDAASQAADGVGASAQSLAGRLESARLPVEAFEARLGSTLDRLVAAIREPAKQIEELGGAVSASARDIAEVGRSVRALGDDAGRLSLALIQLERVAREAAAAGAEPLRPAAEPSRADGAASPVAAAAARPEAATPGRRAGWLRRLFGRRSG